MPFGKKKGEKSGSTYPTQTQMGYPVQQAPPPVPTQQQMYMGPPGYAAGPPPPYQATAAAAGPPPGYPAAGPPPGYPGAPVQGYAPPGGYYAPQYAAPPQQPQQRQQQQAPNTTVVLKGGFDAGARFDGIAQANVPPPPPGVAPNAAQMAMNQGSNVVVTQRQGNFWEGGSDGGYVFF